MDNIQTVNSQHTVSKQKTDGQQMDNGQIIDRQQTVNIQTTHRQKMDNTKDGNRQSTELINRHEQTIDGKHMDSRWTTESRQMENREREFFFFKSSDAV